MSFFTRSGEAIKFKAIRGIQLDVSILRANQIEDSYFISTTFIFFGHVTSTALERSLICVDLDVYDEEFSRDSSKWPYMEEL